MQKLWVVVVVLALLAAACGDDDSDQDATNDPGATSDTAEQESPDGDIDPAGVLKYGAPFKLTKTFDPHKASLGQDNEWLFPAYDRLVHQSPDGEPVPGLATEWNFLA